VFDPDLHQAVAAVETPDAEPGTILETVRKGYAWRGTVLRHAQVRVVAGDAHRVPRADSTGAGDSPEPPADDAGPEREIGATEQD
jgi:hypothetical protein